VLPLPACASLRSIPATSKPRNHFLSLSRHSNPDGHGSLVDERATRRLWHRHSGQEGSNALGRIRNYQRVKFLCASMAVGDQACFLSTPTPAPGITVGSDRNGNYADPVIRAHSLFRSVSSSERLAGMAFACAICAPQVRMLTLDACAKLQHRELHVVRRGIRSRSCGASGYGPPALRTCWNRELIHAPTRRWACHSAPPLLIGPPAARASRVLRAAPGAFIALHLDVPSAN